MDNLTRDCVYISKLKTMWKTIPKFGLGRYDLSTMIWNVAVMLRLVAVKVEINDRSIPPTIYILNVTCAACYIYVYHISMVWFISERASGDPVTAVKVASLGTTSLIGITKMIYMYLYRVKVQNVVARYRLYDNLPPAPGTLELMQQTLKTVKTRAFVFWWIINGNGFIFHLKPLFMTGRHFSFDEQILLGLEPKTETPNYQIALICIVTAGTYITFIVSNITSLLIITAGYSEARALTLGEELRHLWDDAKQHYKENFDAQYKERSDPAQREINKYIKKRLRLIAKSHSTNINLVSNLEDIFREAIAAEFLILSLSLIADLLGGLRHTYIIMPFPLMQVGMDCFTGQRLIDASADFESAIYDSKWENFDASNRKIVLLILQVSQKNLSLSAGGVTVLGFASLMSLCKRIYSAYTTLQSTMK